MENKKVLVFVAKAFEMMEFSAFIDVLGWATHDYGHNLVADTCGFTGKVVSTFNVPVLVVDNNIITSYCPETAPNVAFELLKMLTSEEEMKVIKKAMGF